MGHFSRKVDLTQIKGNPTRSLRASYRELMSIDDPTVLAYRLTAMFAPTVGKENGISQRNWEKFRSTVESLGDNIDKLKFYATNYLLAASGLATVK